MVETRSEACRLDMPVAGCRDCPIFADCGGLDDQQRFWGCFTDCKGTGRCDDRDWTCPCRVNTFIRRWRQVGGLPPSPPKVFRSVANTRLPLYVPLIQHGSSRKRGLLAEVVALPTAEVTRRRRRGGFGPRAETANALRDEFRVSRKTQVLLVSVGDDEPLEVYWELRKTHDTPTALAKLGLLGMTVHNFSFFLDAPRPHTLWNRYRMVRLAEELSDAGVPIVLHINELTAADRDFWVDLLRENQNMTYVAREFQTGNKSPEAGVESLSALRELQDRIGRDLHPIAVGGPQYVDVLARAFRHFTVVDSQPFMQTMFRQRIIVSPDGSCQWRKSPTNKGSPLDELLAYNIRRYGDALKVRAIQASTDRAMSSAADGDQRQLMLL